MQEAFYILFFIKTRYGHGYTSRYTFKALLYYDKGPYYIE